MKKYDAMFLLGLRLKEDGSPEDELVLRVKGAAKCFAEGKAPIIVACGGQLPGRPVTEAEVMRDLLVREGVPSSAIVLEDKSLITTQNIDNGIRVLGGKAGERILVVTSDCHVRRSVLICRRMGLKAGGYGVPLPKMEDTARLWRLDRLLTIDMVMGWQDGKRKRPQWMMRKMMRYLPPNAMHMQADMEKKYKESIESNEKEGK